MRIGFVVNDVKTEHPRYTTTRIARAAREMGHEAWIIGVEDFATEIDDQIRARARMTKGEKHKNGETYLKDLLGDKAHNERIRIADLDILMLRNDPADDAERPWAQTAGILFGELALRHGVIVLNDPTTLSGALNKMYFQHFPPEVRPRHSSHAILKKSKNLSKTKVAERFSNLCKVRAARAFFSSNLKKKPISLR